MNSSMIHTICVVALICIALCACERHAVPGASDGHARVGSSAAVASPLRYDSTEQLSTVRRSLELFVDPGSEAQADDYATRLKTRTGFPADSTADTLDGLLQYLGYPDVRAAELEALPPTQIAQRLGTDGLALRFFAPKIADVSGTPEEAAQKAVGWRKVVRLNARAGSAAAGAGIKSAFLLFNVFQPRAAIAEDPFAACAPNGGCSENNQVMLIVAAPKLNEDTAYWLVFGNTRNGGGRGKFLTATFDGGDVASGASPERKYFVPRACAQCHGGNATRARLNALDTDHWHDRMQSGDDFADVGQHHSALVDGGAGTSSEVFAAVFQTARSLNTEIAAQIRAASGPNQTDFRIRGAESWLGLHAKNVAFLPPIERALAPVNAGGTQWAKGNASDERLLALLNRYCYRCHSSIAYTVFDRDAVLRNADEIVSRVQEGPAQGGMPQDRELPQAIKDEITSLVGTMQ